jgi:inositol 1,4,5-triphosphate receptor type 1
MKDSQQEIKSTVTVNTSDIAAKAHEDKEQGRDLEKLAKKRGGKLLVRKFRFQSGTWHVVLH